MRRELAGGDLPRELAQRILDTAGGNPLYIQELVRMLVEEGVVVRRDGAWEATADIRELAMPATIQALLAARLDQLDDGDRDAAQRAAVVGQVFSRAAVERAVRRAGPPDPREALANLGRKQFIAPEVSALAAGDAFRFSHVLVRDAAYAGLVKRMRAELHERYATWLESARSGSAMEHDEILGYHFEQAAAVPARAGRRPRCGTRRRAGVRTTRRGRAPSARVRRHPGRCQPAQPCRRRPGGEPSTTARHPSRSHSGVDRIGRIEQADAGVDEILAQPSGEPRRGMERECRWPRRRGVPTSTLRCRV